MPANSPIIDNQLRPICLDISSMAKNVTAFGRLVLTAAVAYAFANVEERNGMLRKFVTWNSMGKVTAQ